MNPAAAPASPGGAPPAGVAPARAAAAAASPPATATPGARPAPLRAPATAAGRQPGAVAARSGKGRGKDASRTRIILAGVAGVLVIGIALVLLATQAFDGGGDDPATTPNTVGERPASSTGDGTGAQAGTARSVNRGDFTVAVLNGTTITNLARGAANKIADAGYVEGPVTNDTTNQARDATVIYHAPDARAAALDVARLIRVRSSAVRPLDQGDPTVAGLELLAGEDADVIVSVGQDQAQ